MPRFGAEPRFLKTAHQIGKTLLQAVGQIGIAGAHSDPEFAGLLHHADFHFRCAGLRHLQRDVSHWRGGGFGLGLRDPLGL
jgi:hypothetical protein